MYMEKSKNYCYLSNSALAQRPTKQLQISLVWITQDLGRSPETDCTRYSRRGHTYLGHRKTVIFLDICFHFMKPAFCSFRLRSVDLDDQDLSSNAILCSWNQLNIIQVLQHGTFSCL